MNTYPSTLQSTWIFLRFRGRRLYNFMGSAFSRKSKVDGKRQANAGKGRSSILAVFAILYLVVLGAGLIFSSSEGLKIPSPSQFLTIRIYVLHFFVQMLALIVLNLSSRELASTDSDLEWLATLPAKWPVLLAGKILERAYMNLWGLLLVSGLIGQKIAGGVGIKEAVFSSLLILLPLLAVMGVFQVVVEYFLRLKMKPNRIRNTQAVFQMMSSLLIYLAISPKMIVSLTGFTIATSMHPLFLESAPALAARLWVDPTLSLGYGILSYFVQIILVFILGLYLLNFILKRGSAESSQRESTRNSSLVPKISGQKSKKTFSDTLSIKGSFLSPVVRRELTLLFRDRTYLMQTVFVPFMLMGFNIYRVFADITNGKESASLTTVMATLFFGVAYSLAFSSFQTLNSEGQALWVLYTLPSSIENVVRRKLKIWLSFAFIVIAVAYAYLFTKIDIALNTRNVVLLIAIPVGVYIYSWIAVSLGIFGSKPLEADVRRRVNPDSMFYYLTLISFYAVVFKLDSSWSAAVIVILVSFMSYALWNEARTRLPYLLDPVAIPPPQVTLVHGTSAILFFFMLQLLLGVVLLYFHFEPAFATFLSFTGAGLLVSAGFMIYLMKKKVTGLPRFFGDKGWKGIAAGVAVGIACWGFASLYLHLAMRWSLFPQELGKNDFDVSPANSSSVLWMLPLGVVAAPLFEEFIFRGLVFKSLKNNFSPFLAGAFSAVLFAIVHPMMGFLPVFVVGVATAALYHWAGGLLPAMIVHAVYNGILLFGALRPQLIEAGRKPEPISVPEHIEAPVRQYPIKTSPPAGTSIDPETGVWIDEEGKVRVVPVPNQE